MRISEGFAEPSLQPKVAVFRSGRAPPPSSCPRNGRYGARPLRRLIQSAIGDQLARKILAGQIADGADVLVDLDSEADALTVSAQPTAVAQR